MNEKNTGSSINSREVTPNGSYSSLRDRSSIKIHRSHKLLLDYLAYEHHCNKIDFIDELLEYYAEKKYPEILEDFKNGKL